MSVANLYGLAPCQNKPIHKDDGAWIAKTLCTWDLYQRNSGENQVVYKLNGEFIGCYDLPALTVGQAYLPCRNSNHKQSLLATAVRLHHA